MLLLVLAALLVMTPVAVVSLNEDEAGFEPSDLAVGTGSGDPIGSTSSLDAPPPGLAAVDGDPVPVTAPAEPDPEPVDEARIAANETAAIATLRNLCSAQAQFHATARADEDDDGTGEFGTLAELSGAVNIRGTDRSLNPPVLSGAFRKVAADGTVRRSGYVFAVHLPGRGGEGVAESAGGGIGAGVVDPDLAEKHWVAYAWPEKQGRSGRRTFAVSAAGDIVATDSELYSDEGGPAADAAIHQPAGAGRTITGAPVSGESGPDGNIWRQVN
jgi:hypothetical protein